MPDRDRGRPLGVEISARDIYDELVHLREDVRSLAQSRETTDGVMEDHETRVRSLEKWRWGVGAGAGSGVAAMVIELVRATGKG